MRRNRIRNLMLGTAIASTALYAGLGAQQAAAPAGARPTPALYNTVKQKLRDGRQVVGATVLIGNPDTYCAVANSGFDFTWIEMQHSPMSWQDVAHMVAACKGASAIPFIRVPDATEGDLQKATDIGALGIMVPMVDTVKRRRTPSSSRSIRRSDGAARATIRQDRSGAATTARRSTTT